MQSTLSRLAIDEKANRWDHGSADHHVRRHRPPASATSARSPSCAPAGWAAASPQLYVGLVLYGVSLAMMVRGDLGLAPWDVLHSGLIRARADHPRPGGRGDELRGAAALDPAEGDAGHRHDLQRDASSASRPTRPCGLLDQPGPLALRIALMVGGIVLCGLATALYIGAQFGRGPRDGLMTGLARRTGLSIRLVRTVPRGLRRR